MEKLTDEVRHKSVVYDVPSKRRQLFLFYGINLL